MQSHPKVHDQMTKAMEEMYSSFSQNDSEMILDAIRAFAHRLLETKEVNQILQDAAELIYGLFDFREVLIGLKEENGLYRYRAILGHTRKAEEALRQAEYRIEEMSCSEEFPGVTVGNICEFSFKEDIPDDQLEIRQFNRPSELSKERVFVDRMMEGDYLDVYIYGGNEEMLGWIEVSFPSDGKIPSRETIKGLELLASIIGLALTYLGIPK